LRQSIPQDLDGLGLVERHDQAAARAQLPRTFLANLEMAWSGAFLTRRISSASSLAGAEMTFCS